MQNVVGYSMRRTYISEVEKFRTYKDEETLDFSECYVIKYLLESFDQGLAIQFEMRSGVEYYTVSSDLSEGHRLILVDENANSLTNKHCLTTPLSAVEAFDYLNSEIEKLNLLFFNSLYGIENYFTRYEQLLATDGYIVFHTAVDGELVPALKEYLREKEIYILVFVSKQLTIYKKIDRNHRSSYVKANTYLSEKIKVIYQRAKEKPPLEPIVGLGVLTYNHKGYISECLKGVLSQRGTFRRKIVIVDDHSSDGTSEEIDKFVLKHQNEYRDSELVVIHNEKNMGAAYSIDILFRELQDGTDFFSYIEGDDYWASPDRTQKHLDVLLHQPDYAYSVNAFSLYLQNRNLMIHNSIFAYLSKKRNNTYDLIENYIGDSGCYFYRSELLRAYEKTQIQRMKIEWQLVLLFSKRGDCYFLPEELNVYRKHESGTWSTIPDEVKDLTKISYLENMNMELENLFDNAIANKCVQMMRECYISFGSRYDMVIFGDFEVSSGGMILRDDQRYLLEHFKHTSMVSDYYRMQFLTNNHALEYISDLREKVPHLSSKLWLMSRWYGISAKVLIVLDFETAYMSLAICERYRIPLICVTRDATITDHAMFRRLIDSRFLYGIVASECIRDKMIHVCESTGLAVVPYYVRDDLFGTTEGGKVIGEYIDEIVKGIDYSTIEEKKYVSYDEYNKRFNLYCQYPVTQVDWLSIAQRDNGLVTRQTGCYFFLWKLYRKYCPKRLKPFIKKIVRPFLNKKVA